MEKFVIAGLKTEYNVRGELLRERSKSYKADFDDSETEIKLNIKEDFIKMKKEEIPYLSLDEHEYMWTCEAFYNELLRHNGMMLHSSCVEKDGFAYLFSARSGTGKSTHTHLWLKNLEGTRIINDDKPALIYDNGKWYACGTPFSGKTDENIDVKIPVRAITFLHRSEENTVKKIPPFQAVSLLIEQTIKPADRSLAENMLELADLLLREVPVFSLGCNLQDDAAVVAYNEIERLIKE
ncbi:MAG: hypothetical protein E7528_05830 [Ruminococcaceae bacterium]|nr:hypothetical protein [Oscillospiraceae bacterium]